LRVGLASMDFDNGALIVTEAAWNLRTYWLPSKATADHEMEDEKIVVVEAKHNALAQALERRDGASFNR